jgi:OTU domain-containing protein 6
MARRAAEQEAAAEAALEEAQGMTDHRGVERSSLERAFSAHGLVEHEIRPDGHCLFSAVADQLVQRNIPISPSTSTSDTNGDRDEDKTTPYRVVRRVATDYMELHSDNFAPFLEEPLESYIPKIRDTAEWGGQLELLALASAYRVEIKIVQNGRTETIQPSGGEDAANGDGKGDRTIWLVYYRHRYGLGEHYNSLRKKSWGVWRLQRVLYAYEASPLSHILTGMKDDMAFTRYILLDYREYTGYPLDCIVDC